MSLLSPEPVIDYTARDFSTIRQQLQEFIQATRPESWTDFFDANLGVALIEMLAFVGDNISHGQDVLAQEIFLSTARRLEGPLRFARSVGYVPVSALSAQVVVRTDTLPSDVVLNGALIAAGSVIVGSNGLRYELTTETTVQPGTNALTLILNEGTTYTDTFTPSRSARQEFVVARGIVEDASWTVYIGDPQNPLNAWTQVDNLSFETSASRTYEVFFDGDGKLHIVFGDGNSGQIPSNTISVIYRTTNGAAGNAAKDTIKGSMQASIVGLGTTVSLSLANIGGPATGGRNREGVDEMRRSIPAFIRTLDQVRTIKDYEDSVANLGGVGLVFADVPLSSYSGNIVRVNAWDVESIAFTSTSPESGVSSTIEYTRYVQIPTSRIYNIQQYLRPRVTVTVHNVVVRPTVSQIDLDLGRVAYDAALFKATDVHVGIVRAIVNVFEQGDGFTLRMSDIVSAVLRVPGVRHFTIKKLIWEHIDFDNPPGVITEQFRTDQDASGLQGGPFKALVDIVIPGTQDRAFYDDSFLANNEITYTSAVDNPNVQAINLRSLSFDLRA